MSSIASLRSVHLTLNSRSGPVVILRDVTLEIAANQSVAIVGPSGSGKSSLLMVVAGLERATSGTVVVAGHDYAGLDEDGRAKVRAGNIGIVFQAFHLIPTMTALENVALPLEFADAAEPRSRAASLLAGVGLGHRLDHYPAELSGGEQQRVALARAISLQPQLLLADEPTGNLDSTTGKGVIDMLLGLQDQTGATLVLVTHDEKLAARCDRTIHMADGRIVADRDYSAA
jgi:putative ABC transport system ATP-binding protein